MATTVRISNRTGYPSITLCVPSDSMTSLHTLLSQSFVVDSGYVDSDEVHYVCDGGVMYTVQDQPLITQDEYKAARDD